MKCKLRQRLSWVVTMGLLLLLVLGGARPSLSAPLSGGPSSGWTALISLASDGTQGDSWSTSASISAQGRYVAFRSDAANLVAGDTNSTVDIFVRDRQTGETTRVSVASDGTQADDWSTLPAISASGRYVTFYSAATNLVAGDTNDQLDVFVHDRQTGETSRVSVASDGAQGDAGSDLPSISASGRYVAFSSWATNLVAGDLNATADIFVHDRQTGETTRVSVASDGGQGEDWSTSPSISALGRYVAFTSYATSLVVGDTNDAADVFVRDRQTGETTRVSVASGGAQGDAGSYTPSISADGRYVAFYSLATNLVTGDTNSTADIFVHDRQTGETSRVSVDSDGMQAVGGHCYAPSISADGRYVAFYSYATNLVAGDTNDALDVFAHDRQTGETTRVSVASDGAQGDGGSYSPSISAMGTLVAFDSVATNLVEGDANDTGDVFLHGPWFRVYLPRTVKNFAFWRLTIRLGQDNVEQGLSLDDGGDVDTEVVWAGSPPLEARRTGNGQALPSPDGNDIPDFYMQFDADDGTIFASPPGTRLAIVVEYLDQGTDSFSIQYDAHSGGPFGDGRFKDTGAVIKTNSGEFRTFTFWIGDAYFANRDNGADFRIDDHSNGAEVIHRVTVHP